MDHVTDLRPLVELLVGLLILVLIIFVHGTGIRFINRGFNRAWLTVTVATPYWRTSLILTFTIGAMAALHLV